MLCLKCDPGLIHLRYKYFILVMLSCICQSKCMSFNFVNIRQMRGAQTSSIVMSVATLRNCHMQLNTRGIGILAQILICSFPLCKNLLNCLKPRCIIIKNRLISSMKIILCEIKKTKCAVHWLHHVHPLDFEAM